MKVITARLHGTCVLCPAPIRPGQQIAHHGGRWAHLECLRALALTEAQQRAELRKESEAIMPEETPPRCRDQEAGLTAEEMAQWKADNTAARALFVATGDRRVLLAWADSELARQLAADPADPEDDELPF